MNRYQALLLVSFGGPEKAEDVIPFLARVTAGRGVPRSRTEAVAQHYYAQGGCSPLNSQCRTLVGNLESNLASLQMPVYWGNRNWHPLLEDTVALMRDAGVERALAFVTSAYGGYSSCRQYQDDIAAAQAKVGPGAPAFEKIRLYFNHPGWVEPWAASVAQAMDACPATAGGDAPCESPPLVVFTAHSIPMAMARTSPYVEHVTETARLVAALAGVPRWQLAWQSRSGSPAQPWLGPDISEVLGSAEVLTSPRRAVVVAPIGFVCDNMEIVHDLDVEAAAVARQQGLHFQRASTVGTTPAFAAMVHALVVERLNEPGAGAASLGHLGPWPGTCPRGHCPSAAELAARSAPRAPAQ